MSDVTITVKPRKIDHADPDAAGFTKGYWWTVKTPLGTFESGAATEAQARAAAEDAVTVQGYQVP